ncbi:hypothetical protein DL770_008647 [Monosporascus sp. CRB-9-2]|nr:hypothetical protein DL770_008647 [Monosporascus sp. CRB-9-2]
MSLFPPEILDGPALPPPEGYTSNFDNPPNRNSMVIAVVSICMIFATVFVAIRAFAKCAYLKMTRVEDYLMVPMFATYVGFCVYWLKICGTTGHYVHMWDFRLRGLAPFFRNGFLATQFFGATMLALKPAILLEWVHIFASAGPRNGFNWTCYIVAILNSLMYIIGIFVECFSCSPREHYWDKTIPGTCLENANLLSLISAVLNLALDLVILALPQKIIWNLNMSKTKRLGVSIVFLMGIISVVAATVRLALSVLYVNSSDVTYNISKSGLWCVIEMTAGILVFVAPATPKPMSHLAKQVGSSIDRLIGSGSRSSEQESTWATGRRKSSKSTTYEQIEERGGPLRLMKLRSSKSKSSMQRQNDREHRTESEVEMVRQVGLPK